MNTFAAVVIAVMSVATDTPSETRTDSVAENLRTLVEKLGSGTEPFTGWELVKEIYDYGQCSIPALSDGLEDTRQFLGSCGRNVLEGSGIYYFTPLGVEEDLPQEGTVRVIRAQEVSLYLILALLEEDLYFADHCYTECDCPDPEGYLNSALNEVRSRLRMCGDEGDCTTLLGDIRKILQSYGIRFPGDQEEASSREVGSQR